jgi:long-chain acyl-CoA synthetase
MINLLNKYQNIIFDQNQFDDFQEEFEHVFKEVFKRALVLICMDNSPKAVKLYLYCLAKEYPVLLVNDDTDNSIIEEFIVQFKPKIIFRNNCLNALKLSNDSLIINPQIAVMLTTSGSTGKQKCVMLSYDNLRENMSSISNYLDLSEDSRPLLNLPLSYSYGLSVLHSHLYSNSKVIISSQNPLNKDFYTFIDNNKISHLYCVPFSAELLIRSKIAEKELKHLTTICQAGGHLQSRLKIKLLDFCEQNNKKFFVMYGQTEASPRISYVPPSMLREKIDSIGIPISNGKLSISEEDSEIIYEGPNVMLGYAEKLEDLSLVFQKNNVLKTGDQGRMDEDGYFYITGRLKRMIKIAGVRFNLDSIEKILNQYLDNIFYCVGSDDNLIVVSNKDIDERDIKRLLSDKIHINATKVLIRHLDIIPITDNGKIDYKKIANICLG